ncbi:MAG: acylphosphatase [Alkalispirochaeta sp.]
MAATAFTAHVHGRVQGVGFRYHTQMTALSLGVVGWVRNRRDGTVEVRAEGEEPVLKEFRRYLDQGPPTAHVERVDVRPVEPTGEYRSFLVR